MKKYALLLVLILWFLTQTFSQRLGVNTTTPQETLDVNGNIFLSNKLGVNITNPQFPLSFAPALGDKISLYGNSGPHYGFGIQPNLLQMHTDVPSSDIAFGWGRSLSFTELMRIKGNGNVGIGTNNPLAKLHIKDSSVLFTGPISVTATPGDPPIEGQGVRMMWYPEKAAFRAGYTIFDDWNKGNIGYFSVALGCQTKASGNSSVALGQETRATNYRSVALGFKTWATGWNATATGAGTIASGWYSVTLGSGTTAKAYGGVSLGVNNDQSDNPDPAIAGPLDRIFQVGNGVTASGPNNAILSNAMTILRNGNVGIGVTDPSQKLHTGSGTVRFEGTATAGGTTLSLGGNGDVQVDAPGIVAGRFVIKDNGNVGIGTASPSQKLHVVGNICATGTIASCSDIRYKKDITSISNSLSSVLALNGIYYYWKKNEFPDMQFTGNRQLGFSAQEIEKLFPEMVMTDSNGYKAMDYGRLTPVLVEAIKEQQEQINSLQQEIEEMKKIIERLNK